MSTVIDRIRAYSCLGPPVGQKREASRVRCRLWAIEQIKIHTSYYCRSMPTRKKVKRGAVSYTGGWERRPVDFGKAKGERPRTMVRKQNRLIMPTRK